MAKTKTAIVAYVPVIHEGYLELFKRYPQADLVVVDRELLRREFRSLQKDIRALDTKQIVALLQTLFPKRQVVHLRAKTDVSAYQQLIMPKDEINTWLAAEFFADQNIKTDSIFLRWDEARLKQKQDVAPTEKITYDEFNQHFMSQVAAETQKSSDWWRQTAAALAKDGQLIALAHNTHRPADQQPYIFGDPRANFHRGLMIEVSTSLHAEQAVIAHAAAEGISLRGADLYTTTFPCPFCARLIAYSGIKRVFYHTGYSMLDGAELMTNHGVELIKVED